MGDNRIICNTGCEVQCPVACPGRDCPSVGEFRAEMRALTFGSDLLQAVH